MRILSFFRRFEDGFGRATLHAVLLLSPILIGIGAFIFESQTHSLRGSISAELTAQKAKLTGASAPSQRIAPDFAAQLPRDELAGQWLNWLKDACSANGVVLEGVTTWKSPATPAVLGRAGMVIEAKGGYGQLKAVIASALDRFPNMTLKNLSLRRPSHATNLQARIEFVVLLQPAGSFGSSPASGVPS